MRDNALNMIGHNIVEVLTWERKSSSESDLNPATALSAQLHAACSEGDVDTVRSLLDLGADATSKDQSSNTCLHIAAMFIHENVLDVLLEWKIDPNVVDAQGFTPLHWACYAGNEHMIGSLISNGAHVNLVDADGVPPLFAAVQHGHLRSTLSMLHARARLDKVNKLGHTALMLAASRGHVDTVRLLLVYGADLSVIDPDGLTAHDHARAHRRLGVLDLLLESSLNRETSASGRPTRRMSLQSNKDPSCSLGQLASVDSWEAHQQQLYYRVNQEVVCDIFVRLDDFRRKHAEKAT